MNWNHIHLNHCQINFIDLKVENAKTTLREEHHGTYHQLSLSLRDNSSPNHLICRVTSKSNKKQNRFKTLTFSFLGNA